jgi:hypothetical protein
MAGKTRRPGKGGGVRRAGVVSCWLCGIRLDFSEMMPDGGDWCDDIRWYCRDARACTQRWTTSRRVLLANGEEPQEAALDIRPRTASHLDQAAPVSGGVAPGGPRVSPLLDSQPGPSGMTLTGSGLDPGDRRGAIART